MVSSCTVTRLPVRKLECGRRCNAFRKDLRPWQLSQVRFKFRLAFRVFKKLERLQKRDQRRFLVLG